MTISLKQKSIKICCAQVQNSVSSVSGPALDFEIANLSFKQNDKRKINMKYHSRYIFTFYLETFKKLIGQLWEKRVLIDRFFTAATFSQLHHSEEVMNYDVVGEKQSVAAATTGW